VADKGASSRSVGRYVANAVRRDKGSREPDGHSLDALAGAIVPELRGACDRWRFAPIRSLRPGQRSLTGDAHFRDATIFVKSELGGLTS
jgi:hypothetical protein